MVMPNTGAGNLKFEIQTKVLPAMTSDPNTGYAEQNIRWLVSMLDPWPEWALRIAAEVIAVHLPRVQKRNIFEALKFFHWLFFEADIHSDFKKMNFPQFNLPHDLEGEMFRLLAHLQKHTETFTKEMEEFKAKSPEKWTEHEDKSMQGIRKSFDNVGKSILDLLGKEPPETQLSRMETIVAASKATYDEEGRIRDTTATAVYKQILKSWPEIATFSDVKQLCSFLDPVLGHVDADAKLDRVKKIVRRMGIVFRPVCQGTR